MFSDREQAAERLAERLAHLRGKHPLVLAIPRGGVPMGRIIADALQGELDVVLVHKLGAPGNPEYAIGAVDETGNAHFSRVGETVSPHHLEQEAARQTAALKSRRQRYARPPADPAGRVTIVVDDGIATGETLMAALRLISARQPSRLIAAVAVAPAETLRVVESLADEVVCLATPAWFGSVGAFFANFRQVDDDEVKALLSAKTPANVSDDSKQQEP